jgi:serine/threonine protein kinase
VARPAEVLGGRYRLIRILGHGGMSDVFEATDEESHTSVAVKIVRSADAGLAQRLAQEVRALSRLEHPGLVRLLDTGVADGHAYLVMELVTGPTLAESLRTGAYGPGRTADIGVQLARALEYVHSQGIVHRDVKPSNILMRADGEAMLGDFGIARLADASTLTLAGTTLGTAAYMAPEQLEDHQVGPGADVWSFGMVLLECLTGQRVYEGSPGEVVARRLAGPVPLPGDLPVPWRVLLSGMLDHRPDERLTAEEVAALLAAAPFRQPWVAAERDVTGSLAPTAALDLTALAPGSAATALLAGSSGDTALSRLVPRLRRTTVRWYALIVGLALLALVAGLVLAPGSNPPSPQRHAGATTRADRSGTSTTLAPTTTTPTTTTPPSTLPSSSSALAALLGDVASFQSAGGIDQGSAQTISSQAEQAVSDEGAAKPSAAANDLQQAATAIQTGQQRGKISQSAATTLENDLGALASALGLSAASTPPTTAPGPGGPAGKH